MADRWAVANGDWSNTATWNGGTLPAATDDVYADGYTVTIDQTITAVSINTTQRSGGTAGGGFTFTDGYTINANINAGTTTCVTINTGGTFVVNGDITGGSAVNAYGLHTNTLSVVPTPIVNLTINGNITGGSSNDAYGYELHGNNHTVIITGNITGGSNNNTYGLAARDGNSNTPYSNCQITINGNLNGGLGYDSTAVFAWVSGPITINGDVSGGSGTYSRGCRLYYVNDIEINGDVTGGIGTHSRGIDLDNSSITITGDLIGGSGSIASAVLGSVTNLYLTGDILGASSLSDYYCVELTGGNIYVTGNIDGRASYGAYFRTGTNSVINGNITGSSGPNRPGIFAYGTMVVNGDVIGGVGGDGISTTSTSDITVNGSCLGGVGLKNAINNPYAHVSCKVKRVRGSDDIRFVIYSQQQYVEIEELEFGDTGSSPIQGYVKFKDVTTNTIKVLKTGDLTKTTMIDTAASGDYPVTGDVRSGTAYNYNAFTGTLAVPLASQVAAGVAVDNTVGTAILTEAGLTSILQSVLSFSSSSSVERSPDDTKAISFTWPTAGATLVGTVSIDGGSFTGVAGTVSFLYTDGAGKNWYTLSYNSADRPSSEGVARYVFSDGTYTRSYSLRVEGKVDVSALALESSMQTAISGVNDIPPLITNVVNVSTMEAF